MEYNYSNETSNILGARKVITDYLHCLETEEKELANQITTLTLKKDQDIKKIEETYLEALNEAGKNFTVADSSSQILNEGIMSFNECMSKELMQRFGGLSAFNHENKRLFETEREFEELFSKLSAIANKQKDKSEAKEFYLMRIFEKKKDEIAEVNIKYDVEISKLNPKHTLIVKKIEMLLNALKSFDAAIANASKV